MKGTDPNLLPKVLDLPKHIVEGSLDGLRRPGSHPPARHDNLGFDYPSAKSRATDDQELDLDPDAPQAARSGGHESFIGSMRKAARDKAAKHEPLVPDEGSPAPPPVVQPGKGAPVGDVTPQGGFRSKLPDDDVIPDSNRA